MAVFNITIISDTVCPFCYLGRARLGRAIDLYRKTVPGGPSSTFNIRWHAYRLDLSPPAESVLVTDVAAKKFGADRLLSKRARMAQLGSQEGFNFTFSGRIGNTRDSHRLIQLGRARGPDMEDRVAMAVMRMFFEHGGDICGWGDLSRAVEQLGISPAETQEWLQGNGGADQVDQEVREAYAKGFKGVPTFIINDKYEVDGAADVSDFLGRLVEAAGERDDVDVPVSSSSICRVEGCAL
ncbi:DSBA oxidoreductase [Moelleriella libera RCEF 2490]|uniref:DSBA oxidoreductase n=1 Tax=Moelleriella libera RCEF 2490 TaxID=1081109 RepID=A0A166NU27_9HYPO|nr:DSBA oxidoreductase [Moelleriella libera RCEF 2490]